MNQRILNRSGKLPDDGFYQIEAVGEHINHGAKVIQVIDAKSVASIVNRFNAEAEKRGEEYPGMPIDKDHLSSSMENPTESLGWTMALRNRDGVPEAKIEWTALGRPLIESAPKQPPVYKFFSTEYDPAECEEIGTRIVNKKTYQIVRPMRLDGLSLTNNPNNKGQRAISNRGSNQAGADDEEPTTTMKSLLKKLGLAEDASEESAVVALQAITNRATTAEADRDAFKAERDQLLTAQVDADLEKYKNRYKPENREKLKKQLIANRAGTIELLEALEPSAAAPTRITNRETATPPSAKDASGDDKTQARKIRNRADELKAANPKRTFDSCWTQAQSEVASA